ncbi:MAG: hypothetical protein ACP5OU_03180, partial [Methanothrix sp.]
MDAIMFADLFQDNLVVVLQVLRSPGCIFPHNPCQIRKSVNVFLIVFYHESSPKKEEGSAYPPPFSDLFETT